MLLFYLAYLFVNNSLKQNQLYAGIAAFFIIFFFVLDYQFSVMGDEIRHFYVVKNKVETCDISYIHSDCNTTETIDFVNNTYTQNYFAYRDSQFTNNGLVANLSLLAFALFVIAYVWDIIKKTGLAR